MVAMLCLVVLGCGPHAELDEQAACIEGDVIVEVPPDPARVEELEGVRCIRGRLTVRPNFDFPDDSLPADALSLLATLEIVEGDVWIYGTPLESLDFFASLSRVDGDFRVLANHRLVELEGPPQLAEIGGSLRIEDNYSLVSIGGFEALHTVGGLLVTGNQALLAVIGPTQLQRIDGDLRISAANDLEILEGLQAVREVTGSIEMGECFGDFGDLGALSSFGGLRNLETIGGDLRLVCVNGPQSLEQLGKLASIGGDLRLEGNYFYGTSGVRRFATGNLQHVGGGVWITRMSEFINFVGLESVDELAFLHVDLLPELESLTGLSADLRVGDVTIKNTATGQAEVDEFLASIEVTGTVETCGNSEDLSEWCD
jgi:hypothetical protein